uniref:OB domain-containing protein n=1 Tax=Schistocephalus solidus TaxID=70667 RepID=A0A0V0J828_SCHSO
MTSVHDDSQWISGTVLEPPSIQSKVPVVLDPLTTNHCRLLIGDIQKVQQTGDSLNLFRLGPRWIIHVDIYGTIRRLEPREKCYTAEVEDGTGTITVTIWRKTPFVSPEGLLDDSRSPTVSFVRRLIELSNLVRPAACRSEHEGPSLRLGSTVHLRGRLNFFRERITVSAYYCRKCLGVKKFSLKPSRFITFLTERWRCWASNALFCLAWNKIILEKSLQQPAFETTLGHTSSYYLIHILPAIDYPSHQMSLLNTME